MTKRQNVKGNSPYEPIVGFSRAVRLGSHVHVAGTVATGADGAIVGKGDVEVDAVVDEAVRSGDEQQEGR